MQIKSKEDFTHELLQEFILSEALTNLGIPIETVCPVMDHELLRPESMNNRKNFSKVNRYLQNIQRYINQIFPHQNIDVEGSLKLFGNPKESIEFNEATNQVIRNEFGGINITNQELMRATDSEYERNAADNLRSAYYRSREFANLCRVYDLGEAYFHANAMVRELYSSNISGVLVYLPDGAEFDRKVYSQAEGILIFS